MTFFLGNPVFLCVNMSLCQLLYVYASSFLKDIEAECKYRSSSGRVTKAVFCWVGLSWVIGTLGLVDLGQGLFGVDT